MGGPSVVAVEDAVEDTIVIVVAGVVKVEIGVSMVVDIETENESP
jgi:hypothetical protein